MYWLESRYTEPGRHPELTRRKITVQYANPAATEFALAPIRLSERQWDFLPNGKLGIVSSGARQIPAPTKQDFAVPASVPSDWAKSEKLSGEWVSGDWADPGRAWYSGWYRQKITVPKAWNGKRIKLLIDDPHTYALVFANGKRAEAVEWPGGTVDLTPFAQPGKELDLAVYVKPEPYFGLYRVGREIAGDAYRAPLPRLRGLRGDVVLFPESPSARIDGAAIRTSVRDRRLNVVFECAGLTPGQKYVLDGEASAAGRTVRQLPRTVFTANAEKQNVTVSANWKDPILWELNEPYLYDFTARLSDVRGKVLDRRFPERFGFREVLANGPALMLNGRPVTLFMTLISPADTPWLAQYCEKFNFNVFYQFNGAKDAAFFDEAGITGTGERIYMETSLHAQILTRLGKENDPRFWREAERTLTHLVKMRRNHPSVFFQRGVLGGGRNGNGGMYNPYFANGTWVRTQPDNVIAQNTVKAANRVFAMLRRLDPDRIITAQDSGSINDTRHITEYPGFKPIQEIIEEGLYWKRISSKPFFISEQAAPFWANWTDACSQGKGWTGVPSYQEWAAITHGDSAYPRDPFYNGILTRLEKTVQNRRADAKKKSKTSGEYEAALKKIRLGIDVPLIQQKENGPLHCTITRERLLEQTFFNRAHNIGMVSFLFTSGPELGSVCEEVQAPVTGFLAGTKEKITLKNHIFRPGELLERGAVLLNNTHKPESLTCSWKLDINGRTIASGSKTETVPPGGQVFVPFRAKLPVSGDSSGILTAEFFRNGKSLRKDSCKISILAPRTFRNDFRIALVDPEGATAKQFDLLGIRYTPVLFDEDLSKFDLIVFGRRAFRYEFSLLAKGLDLGRLMQAGKRVLIMEQEEDVLRDRFKFRTEYLSPRAVFGRTGGHPLLDGLPDDVLRYWRGSATLTDGFEVARAKKLPVSGEFGNGGTWKYLWNDGAEHPRPIKWGNTHNVATVAVIKPDTGNFRTLADCGYGSNYAAAWELENGPGRIVFSQLDLSGRTEQDPAAERFLMNLVTYSASAKNAPERIAVYRGGKKGAELMKFLNIPIVKSASTAEKTVLVLGELPAEKLSAYKNELADFVKQGGTVFSLAKNADAFNANWTPFPVSARKRTINQTLIGKPVEPLLAGLGSADFLWKGNVEFTSLENLPQNAFRLETGIFAKVPFGKGCYVFCQADPAIFGDVERDHWLKDSKRITERTIRTLLTNLGVKMPEPRLLSVPKSDLEQKYAMNLTGNWQVVKGNPAEDDAPAAENPAWKPIRIPGSPQKMYPEWSGLQGRFWFRREFTLEKPLPKDAVLRMLIGCISGENILFVNGKKAAVTNTETDVNTVADMVRDYTLPADLFRAGKNELLLRVDYETNAALGLRNSNGGITGPFELRVLEKRASSKIPEPIELAGREWWGHPVKSPNDKWVHSIRKRLTVPGAVQPQYTEWGNLTGYFRYWREIRLLEPLPEEANPVLMLGSVDDEDTTFFNGVRIGHTGKDTNPNDYWMAPRAYPIPRGLFKVGNNRIEIMVHDFNNSGGIMSGPVRIVFEDPAVTRARKLAERPYLYDVSRREDPYWHHGF